MLPYLGGNTNTTAALRLLRDVIFQPQNGDRIAVRNVAVLIANGESTLNADQVFFRIITVEPELLYELYWIVVITN